MIGLPWGAAGFGIAIASGGDGGAASVGGAGAVSRGAFREELWFDNGRPERGEAVPTATDPAGIGSGTVTEIEGLGVRSIGASWRRGVVERLVSFQRAGVDVGTFGVTGFDPATTTIYLEDAALGRIQPGDSFRGSVGIGSLFVRGSARVVFADDLVTPSGSPTWVEVDASSTLVAPGISILEPPPESCLARLSSFSPLNESSRSTERTDRATVPSRPALPPVTGPKTPLFP